MNRFDATLSQNLRASFSLLSVAAAAMALMPVAAHADFGASARAADGASGTGPGGSLAAWNYYGPGAVFNRSDNQSVVAASGDATSAKASTSDSGINHSSTSAYADLASGSVHATQENSGTTQYGAQGSASALWHDTLTFTAAGASADTVTTVHVDFVVDGAMYSPTGGDSSFGDMATSLSIGGYDARAIVSYRPGDAFAVAAPDTYPSAWGGVWTVSGDVAKTLSFSGDITFLGASALLPIAMDMELDCAYGMMCDYADTGKVSFVLPSNVSYTSESGVFLSDAGIPVAAVPEPETWALMLAGFATVGGFARRRQMRA
jgi:hypothetical protein